MSRVFDGMNGVNCTVEDMVMCVPAATGKKICHAVEELSLL